MTTAATDAAVVLTKKTNDAIGSDAISTIREHEPINPNSVNNVIVETSNDGAKSTVSALAGKENTSGDSARKDSMQIKQPTIQPKFAERDESTPLHKACMRNVPVKTITPLLNAHPEATLLQDHNGHTPLHHASWRSSPDVVRLLLESNILPATMKDHNDETPLEILCLVRHYKIKAALDSPLPLRNRNNPMSVINRDSRLVQIWSNACLLVKAEYQNTIQDLPHLKFRMVHACMAMERCPDNLLQLAMKLHPEQMWEVDEDGNLPLHLAADVNTPEQNRDAFRARADAVLWRCRRQSSSSINQRLPKLRLWSIERVRNEHGNVETILHDVDDALTSKENPKVKQYEFATGQNMTGQRSEWTFPDAFRLWINCPRQEYMLMTQMDD